MRHIWICIIDGVLVRSGMVQPGDTMPLLLERLLRVFPHMAPDSVKVVAEDGRIFDNELWFASPSLGEAKRPDGDDALAAVGVVEGHVGVKVHHGKSAEEILGAEANTFSGRLTDNMDFGLYDFAGEQVASIEDIITLIGPENSPDLGPYAPQPQMGGNAQRRRARRQQRGRRGRGRPNRGGGGGPMNSGNPGAGHSEAPAAGPNPAGSPPPPSPESPAS